MAFGKGDFRQFIIKRPYKLCFQTEPNSDAGRRAKVGLDHAEQVGRAYDQPVPAIQR